MLQSALNDLIAQVFGSTAKIITQRPMTGGCINTVQQLELDNGILLVAKTNPNPPPHFFQREAEGLKTLSEVQAGPMTPKALAWNAHVLLMSHIDTGPRTDRSAAKLGNALARMHQMRQTHHGFEFDNYLGESPQPNPKQKNGVAFFQNARLAHFLNLADATCRIPRSISEDIKQLIDELPVRLAIPNSEAPSLLHGDLWSGNWVADKDEEPWLIDPACHYGFRETDIAMTELFGGFPPEFYRAYEAVLPLAEGYTKRRPIYQLVHMLNHVALFGAGYLADCRRLLQQLEPIEKC